MIEWKECKHAWSKDQMREWNGMVATYHQEGQALLREEAMKRLDKAKAEQVEAQQAKEDPRVPIGGKHEEALLEWIVKVDSPDVMEVRLNWFKRKYLSNSYEHLHDIYCQIIYMRRCKIEEDQWHAEKMNREGY